MTDFQQTQQFIPGDNPCGEATQMMGSAQATQMVVSTTCPVCQTANPPGDQYCLDCGFLLTSTPVEVEAQEIIIPGKLIEQISGREFPLKPGPNTVGRQDCDVLLVDGSVSRKHATITLADGKCTVEDTGSSNGTFVDGKQAATGEQVEVATGAALKFGACALRLELTELAEAVKVVEGAEAVEGVEVVETAEAVEGTEAVQGLEAVVETQPSEASAAPEMPGAEEAPVVAEAPAPVATLVGIDGTAGEYHIVAGENTVGRRAENMLAISDDPYVSGSHAIITAADDAFHITDLGSSNGTFIGENKLNPNEPVEIHPGDEIVMGKSKFRLETVNSEQ